MYLLLPKDIDFSVNVQHDCFKHACPLDGTLTKMQEGRTTVLQAQTVRHIDDNDFILNIHIFHHYDELTARLDPRFIGPIRQRLPEERVAIRLAAAKVLRSQISTREATKGAVRKARTTARTAQHPPPTAGDVPVPDSDVHSSAQEVQAHSENPNQETREPGETTSKNNLDVRNGHQGSQQDWQEETVENRGKQQRERWQSALQGILPIHLQVILDVLKLLLQTIDSCRDRRKDVEHGLEDLLRRSAVWFGISSNSDWGAPFSDCSGMRVMNPQKLTLHAGKHSCPPAVPHILRKADATPRPLHINEQSQGPARTRRASAAFSDNASDDDTRNPPLAKYLRLAAIPGLSTEQVTEAAGMAQLTPRMVRVVAYAQTLALGNIVDKLEAVVMQSTVNSQEADRIRKFARIAIFTPMPHQWKSGRTPVIFKLLKDNKKLLKDLEKHQNRIDAVNSDIGEVLSRARSAVKGKILATLGVPANQAVNIFALCELLLDELCVKNQVLITREVLAGVAYLRGLLEFERGNGATGREAWDILDVRLRAALEGRSAVPVRMEYLQDWLARDMQVHGAIPGNAIIKPSMGELQQQIASAMQTADYVDEAPVL
ncbi:hypothetical protein C8T65DRAFT_697904 [Cerioporus squamosus]|nr:hypothetical protein C8T65DRAFT_697904 [Cerioporus squamosus]